MKKINTSMLTELSNNELLNINGGTTPRLDGAVVLVLEGAEGIITYSVGFFKGWYAAWTE